MKRIELMGPPGAGKTTLYRELQRMKPKGVLFSDDFFPIGLVLPPPPRWLVSAYAQCDETPETIQMRLQATKRDLAEADAVCKIQTPGVALMDESVCQRCLSLALSRPRDVGVLNAYCNRVPLPSAILLVLADAKTLEERNASRTDGHKSCDAQFAINSCFMVSRRLQGFGVRVFSIETTSTINRAADIAANYITAELCV